ncbi:cytoskeletal protein CcmA (bactofilin family) [Litoreibacter meonggei]|uniref:Cytoskeletal protein CcmA (Bactofilin family) n=1 Tax=Litoreibacter meonggei TaxID=1049199 RepID=A0A497VE67_9RHOB|nr:polymer-forming cytoskeletal protein [Litoreibacter meonggei]RLJ41612.1 cytoskeletal protein CcmA (bactofilin family) [Litoreibacter meonggei]
MFSKSKINDPSAKPTEGTSDQAKPAPSSSSSAAPKPDFAASAPRPKAPPSILSTDLTVTGNMKSTGDIQVEGNVEGDIHAHLLTVGETAVIKGEIVADDVVVNGRVIGRVRGLKVRLTSTARVEGDIIHKTIAIESGAHFEGSVQRQEDPLNTGAAKNAGGGSKTTHAAPAAASAENPKV